MKTLGLIGGTGWISTVEYYRIINEAINKELGGLNFARLLIKPEDTAMPLFHTTLIHSLAAVDFALGRDA